MLKRFIAKGAWQQARRAGSAGAALVLAAAAASSAIAADLRSVSERAAVLYDAPSARAKKLYVVGQHYPLEVVVNLDTWVKVRDVSGEMTWIEKKFLSERRTVIVTVATADVRQAADEKSALVFQAREGVILELAEIGVAGWIRVQHRDGQGGYIRGNEVFDPLYNGATVGEVMGPVTFLGARGVRLDTVGSYIRYLIPQTISSGEFSMEVEGLRANAPGDKSKVFGMQEGTSDYITNRYRVDIQYRGTAGFPPNAITYRVVYGDGDDLDKRFEPTTSQRNSSVFALDPNTTYYWKFTWGSQEVRTTVKVGGINGPTIYDLARPVTDGSYNPQPMYAFIGTPTGRSGGESASIPGTIYRNVWIGARPRP